MLWLGLFKQFKSLKKQATKKGSVGEVKFGMGADLNFTNSDGRTPLMLYALLTQSP
jgi:hypothetical protein